MMILLVQIQNNTVMNDFRRINTLDFMSTHCRNNKLEAANKINNFTLEFNITNMNPQTFAKVRLLIVTSQMYDKNNNIVLTTNNINNVIINMQKINDLQNKIYQALPRFCNFVIFSFEHNKNTLLCLSLDASNHPVSIILFNPP